MGTRMLFIHLRALVELYCGNRGGGPLGAGGGRFCDLNGWGMNCPIGAMVHLSTLTSCRALTTLIALLRRLW